MRLLIIALLVVTTAFAAENEAAQFAAYQKDKLVFMERDDALQCDTCTRDYYSNDKLVGRLPRIDDAYFAEPAHIAQSPQAAKAYFSNKEAVKRAVRQGSKGADAYFGDERTYASMTLEELSAASEYFEGPTNLGKDPQATAAYFRRVHGIELDVPQGMSKLSYNGEAGTLTNGQETLMLKSLLQGSTVKALAEPGFEINGHTITGFGRVVYAHGDAVSTAFTVDDMTAILPRRGFVNRLGGRMEISQAVQLRTTEGAVLNGWEENLFVYTDGTNVKNIGDPAVHLGPGGFVANAHAFAKFEKQGFKALVINGDLRILPGSKAIPKGITLSAYNQAGQALTFDTNVRRVIGAPIRASSGEITAKGEHVRAAQEALKNAGYLAPTQKLRNGKIVNSVDGKYGKQTTGAVKTFQLAEGIYTKGDPGLGSLDATTMDKLMGPSGRVAVVDLGGLYRAGYHPTFFGDHTTQSPSFPTRPQLTPSNLRSRFDTPATAPEEDMVRYFSDLSRNQPNEQAQLSRTIPAAIYQAAREAELQYGFPIDPAKLIALSVWETGWFSSPAAITRNNFGGIQAPGGGTRRYDTPLEGARAFVEHMYTSSYYFKQGKYTMKSVSNTWCPREDTGCSEHYGGITRIYNSFRRQA
ncbi:glucosaminidase domain-containing protein [Candidatus Woesearchaeota archaeon]|nr:glucosaminidase domain-containing protein [Candidatus Woesearchaeota archaeon]